MCDCNFICDCNYSKKIMNEKRVADYDFAIATLKKKLQEK
jgi:DNA polymerase III delta prime subunit